MFCSRPRPLSPLHPVAKWFSVFGLAFAAWLTSAASLRASDLDDAMAGILIYIMEEGSIGYTLNDAGADSLQQYQAKAYDVTSVIVSFDRGNGETARYTLTSGAYEFRANNGHWELYRTTTRVVIDNSQNDSDFQFVAANQTQTILAGHTHILTCAYPIFARFDNGQDKVVERRMFSGDYVISTDANGAWDIFPKP